jgi:hypothetical protein
MPVELRVGQRRHRDDVGAGPVREPYEEAKVMLEDLRQCFEQDLYGVPKGMWGHI